MEWGDSPEDIAGSRLVFDDPDDEPQYVEVHVLSRPRRPRPSVFARIRAWLGQILSRRQGSHDR